MRTVTRNLLVVIALVSLGLLALGALPGMLLGAGEPYHLTLEPVAEDGPAVDVDDVTDRRYPYLVSALESDDGVSEGYQVGQFGLKEHFTHTPFDEVDALQQLDPEAAETDGVFIEYEGERYYATVAQSPT